jgi:hypothetical protein
MRAQLQGSPAQYHAPPSDRRLISDYPKLRLRSGKPHDRSDEVRTIGGKYPARAQDNVAGETFAHLLLACELAAAIHIERPRWIILRAGWGFSPSEDVVGGKVDER